MEPIIKFFVTVFFGVIQTTYAPTPGTLEEIQRAGTLRVATRAGPTTYYPTAQGPKGLEYELASRFAAELGVKLEIVIADPPSKMLEMVSANQVHLAAAGLTISDERKRFVRFGPGYQKVRSLVVYRGGFARARKVEDLLNDNRCLLVASNNDYLFPLRQLQKNHPELVWRETQRTGIEELLERVDEQLINFTVAQSHELAHYLRRWPDLQPGLELTDEQPIAWMFPRISRDDSLYLAALQFFTRMRQNGEIKQLLEQYYGHVTDFNYVNTKKFHEHIEQRLPEYRSAFQNVAEREGLDWRLLAAIGYQESRWNPDAVSHTGVRGIMQLTEDTAERMGIDNRRDPMQSIIGGGKYFRLLRKGLPESIEEPDRTWMALAAYNQGLGHLHDARKLAARNGDNPDLWLDVKPFVRRLSQPKWHRQTRHGYARGFEAVSYVKRVREFHAILVQEFPPQALREKNLEPPLPEKGLGLKRIPGMKNVLSPGPGLTKPGRGFNTQEIP